MKEKLLTTLLFLIIIVMITILTIETDNGFKPKKECCNQTCPKRNDSSEPVIMNLLNKYIVSL
jgi:hypothetical protein